MSPLRLSRASRTTLVAGVLLALIGFPLVLLAFLSTTPAGPRTIASLAAWGGEPQQKHEEGFITPTSQVLKGEMKGKGLDWQGEYTRLSEMSGWVSRADSLADDS